jgi:branched-chain amino acid transport system permease protein
MTTATATQTKKSATSVRLRANRGRLAFAAFFLFVLIYSMTAMGTDDWFITLIRGLAVGAITFLVVSGLSLILGLMDVLNLAHGELYMLGAYLGWMIYVRPDTFLDLVTPIALALSGLAMLHVWRRFTSQWSVRRWARITAGIAAVITGIGLVWFLLPRFPLSIWNPEVFSEAPTNDALAFSAGTQGLPKSAGFNGVAPVAGMVGMWLAGAIIAFGVAAFVERDATTAARAPRRSDYLGVAAAALAGLVVFAANNPLTEWWYGLSTTWRFFAALALTTVIAFGMGMFIEVVFIRPLYDRLLYQIMMTLGLGYVVVEAVRSMWGRPSFTMPKPAIFNGTGEGCPGEGFGGLFSGCGTVKVFGSRIRMYNEVFVILVGVMVLVVISLLLNRTRLGMIIRAGVEDAEMVEALGINVRRVFTITFGLGVALAGFGGVIAGPALGLSTGMGASVLLLALIAMAIGGLTSFPGAAVGAVIVGIVQQLMIKFGSVGIPLPGLAEPWKPSPALVPVSVILLMVVVLLVLPNGLFGREE